MVGCTPSWQSWRCSLGDGTHLARQAVLRRPHHTCGACRMSTCILTPFPSIRLPRQETPQSRHVGPRTSHLFLCMGWKCHLRSTRYRRECAERGATARYDGGVKVGRDATFISRVMLLLCDGHFRTTDVDEAYMYCVLQYYMYCSCAMTHTVGSYRYSEPGSTVPVQQGLDHLKSDCLTHTTDAQMHKDSYVLQGSLRFHGHLPLPRLMSDEEFARRST